MPGTRALRSAVRLRGKGGCGRMLPGPASPGPGTSTNMLSSCALCRNGLSAKLSEAQGKDQALAQPLAGLSTRRCQPSASRPILMTARQSGTACTLGRSAADIYTTELDVECHVSSVSQSLEDMRAQQGKQP